MASTNDSVDSSIGTLVALKNRTFKFIYKAHVYVGLFVAAHFLILSISGLVLLFKDELQGHDETTQATALSPAQVAEGYQRILSAAQAANPAARPLALFPSDDNPERIQARLGENGATQLRGSKRLLFDLRSGQSVTASEPAAGGFFDWMLRLHRELFLGSVGKLYVGFVGALYVLMLVSGFFIYGKFMKSRAFGEIRRGALPSSVDLHKFTGVVTFGWALVVGFSGVLLAFNGVLIKLFQSVSLRHLTSQYQSQPAVTEAAPFQRVIETALATRPGSSLTYISFPNTEYGIPAHFLVLVNGADALTKRISEMLVINAQSAQLTEVVQLPLYLKAVLLSEPLHFGDYGGLFLKVIWALFTLATLGVTMLGVISFFLKRRKVKRAGPVARAQRPSPRSLYALPLAVAVLSVASLLVALFKGGAIGVALLLVPLALLIFGARRGQEH